MNTPASLSADTTITTAPLHYWRALYWEPVSGTGERIMVGVLHNYHNQPGATRMLRDDVLQALYGDAADGARKLIDQSLDMYRIVATAGNMQDTDISMLALHPGPLRHTAARTLSELLHTAALMSSSVANIDKFDDLKESDSPQQEEVNQRFSTEVRAIVTQQHPELRTYFGRTAPLREGGTPVRFGYCSPRVVAHFSVLHPVRHGPSVRDARARLWEVARAMEITGIGTGILIAAIPRDDDATLGNRQRAAAQAYQVEIEREADAERIRLLPVHTAQQGADRLVELET